jgi:hypothetical protein
MAAEERVEGARKPTGSGGNGEEALRSPTPSPELVRQVTEAVYQLLLADLRREREQRGGVGGCSGCPPAASHHLGSKRG